MTINERLQALRELMQREHLGAFIFPSTDPHQSEYTADHWKGREWISGFNGSAGTAVVTMNTAALWTDSRYFLAAEEQLRGTEFQLMKLKVDGTPTIAEWLNTQHSTLRSAEGRLQGKNIQHSTEVAIDGTCCAASYIRELTAELRKAGGLTLRTNLDPLRFIWRDRPAIPTRPVTIHPLKYAGEPAHEKLARIRQALRREHADGMLMAALDDIAWTLNLRGTDVHCNPVFVSYLLISTTSATLYINKVKLSPDVVAYLQAEGVGVDDYEHVAQGLKDYFEYNILLDPDEVNYTLFKAVTRQVVEAESPVKRMKTVKNPTEIAGFKAAMLRDGIAMVKFLYNLELRIKNLEEAGASNLELRIKNLEGANAVPVGEGMAPASSKFLILNSKLEAPASSKFLILNSKLSEMSISDHLAALRAQQPLFRDISFDTIAAYGPHGAIVHYEPTPETDAELKPEGLLLLDSGAQYDDGTTDITRTISLGPVTDEMRHVYTLVLKGHIQIELAKFPSGISGTQLDVLAKQAMWRDGLSYLHGTGHGVGSYLCVHEGPHQIRMEWKPAPLVAGMTVTDEPGIYLAGRFGVRIENTLLIVPYRETEFGQFLQFEPLTLCPIDTRPIDRQLLTDEEVAWLNGYHRLVYDRLSPHLDADEQAWLADATKPLP